MRISVLGQLTIVAPNSSAIPVSGRVGHLLAVLAARANENLPAAFLVDAIWGGENLRNPKSALQVAVNRLRHLLESPAEDAWLMLVSQGGGYRLSVDQVSYDALDFESQVVAARRLRQTDDLAEAAEQYQAALGLWTGSAFGDYSHEPEVRAEAVRLEEAKLAAEDEHTELLLGLGEHDRIIPILTARIDAAPLRERRWAQLMLALYRSNRQSDALRTYQRLRSVMGEELGIEPSHDLRQLEEAILLQDPDLSLTPAPKSILPPQFPNEFIGRDHEILELGSALKKRRLVTIVGIGGMGKTRLAIEMARRAQTEYSDGVVYLNLAELVGDRQIEAYVVDRLQTPGRHDRPGEDLDAIVDLLRNRDTLLVLDNAEEFKATVRSLLEIIAASCPQVRVLATSRIPLRYVGETVWHLPPMRHRTESDEAIELLSDRSGLRTDPANAADLLEICRLTGGVPLGLELAASALTTSPPSDVAELLRKDLAALDRMTASSNHRAILAVTRWSLDHVEEDGRKTLGCLCLFRGGFDAEAARHVVSQVASLDPDEVTHQLHNLVESGLIRFANDRYSIIEPVRQVAEMDLGVDEVEALTDAHIAYFANLAMRARQAFEFVGSDQEEWYLRLERERANFGAMLERSIAKGDTNVLDAIPGLALYWYRRGEVKEGSEWIGRALERFSPVEDQHLESLLLGAHIAMWAGEAARSDARLSELESRVTAFGPSPISLRTKHSRANLIGWGFGRPAESIPVFLEAVELSRQLQYPAGLVSLLSAAYMAVRSGDNRRALELIEQVPELAGLMSMVTGRDGSAFADLGTDQIVGLVDLYEGRLQSAEELMYRSVEGALAVGIGAIAGPLLVPAGWASLLSGSTDRAEETAMRSLRYVQNEAAGWREAEPLCLLGGLALKQSNFEAAARWFARALADAARAPELDLVVWALACLAGLDHAMGKRTGAGHMKGHLEALASDIVLVLPEPVIEMLELSSIEAISCDRIGTARELEHLITSIKLDTRLDWKDIL